METWESGATWMSEGKAVTVEGAASTKAQTWSTFGSKEASGASVG